MGGRIPKNISFRLDFLRGVAAQFVLIEHILTTSGYHGVFIGSFGVVIFFILSGFLIHFTTLSAYHRGIFSLHYYFSRRFFRIFTLYIPMLIICFAIDNVVSAYGFSRPEKVIQNSTIQNLLGSFFMLQQNVFSEVASQLLGFEGFRLKPYGSARPFWTVAVEWWIYVFYGFMFALIYCHQKLPSLFSLRGFLFCFAAITVLFNAVSGIGHNLSIIWIFGALVGHYLYFSGFSVRKEYLRAIYFTMAILSLLFFSRIVHMMLSPLYLVPIPYDLDGALLCVSFFGLFLIIPRSPFDGGILGRLSKFMGEISYSLYLIHYTILSLLYGLGWFASFSIETFIVAFIGCNLLASALYYLIDKHHHFVWKWYWSRVMCREGG